MYIEVCVTKFMFPSLRLYLRPIKSWYDRLTRHFCAIASGINQWLVKLNLHYFQAFLLSIKHICEAILHTVTVKMFLKISFVEILRNNGSVFIWLGCVKSMLTILHQLFCSSCWFRFEMRMNLSIIKIESSIILHSCWFLLIGLGSQ